jgi:HlyD family secretion protein
LGDSAYAAVVTTVGQSGRATTSSGSQATHFLVRARLLSPPEALRPKMTADLEIQIGRADSVLVVPIQALVAHPETVVQGWEEREKDGSEKRARKERRSTPEPAAGASKKLLEGVFVLDGEFARFRKIETGLRSDTHVEAKGDLTPGQKIVTGPFRVLRDLEGGDRVSIKKSAEERADARATS